jgi:hypothetical protein
MDFFALRLARHIGQGVEHFYIYDHGSREPVSEFLKALDAGIRDKVTVTDWSGSHVHAQDEAYNDCLRRFGADNRWLGFVDVDEHARVMNGQTLPELLQNYAEYAGLFAVWLLYGACGQKEKSASPLRERFRALAQADVFDWKMGKVFVQPSLMQSVHIHNGQPLAGFKVVTETKEEVPDRQIFTENPTCNLICVDHYYTKSYEEWLEKLRRGSCDSDYVRKYNDFFRFNADMEHCREEAYPVQEYEVSTKRATQV